MNTSTTAIKQSRARRELLPMLAAGLLGLFVIFVTGHVQATALHDAAHDVRHATGFPCH